MRTSEVRPTRRSAAVADQQLLLLDADTVDGLRGSLHRLAAQVGAPDPGGLGDLAATLRGRLGDRAVRAAVVAGTPRQAGERLDRLAAALPADGTAVLDVAHGVFAGRAGTAASIGFVFPGQGADVRPGPSALARRFDSVRQLHRTVDTPAAGELVGAAAAGRRIVTSSLAGLRVLTALGIEASITTGHSLGELTALHWAGALTEPALLDLVAAHGAIMDEVCDGSGTMGRIDARPDEVAPLLRGEPVVVAGHNTPAQTVISGPVDAVARVRQVAVAAGFEAGALPVGESFHSPSMAPATAPLRAHLAGVPFGPVERSVASTVTGDVLPPVADLRSLLTRQITAPVRFSEAVGRMAEEVGLIVEVGPDQLLSRLVARTAPGVAVVPLATDGPSLSGLLATAGAAWVLGAPLRTDLLPAGDLVPGEGG